jgi:tRNA wybutosine-synthesizing protein 1
MEEGLKAILQRQGYRLVGNHSAVKVCHWLKESLLRGRPCYKARFYGIESHRCLQMTPSVAWCQHRCLFCWRPVEHSLGAEISGELDPPEAIVEGAIVLQRQLLTGYWGEARADPERVREAHDPRHVALSLAGEPTNYAPIADLIEAFHRRRMTTFLVTNGMNPEVLEEVAPTQLYLSLIAHSEALYRRIHRPLVRNGWERLRRSLRVFGEKGGRRVVRITLVRGYNLEAPERFAGLIREADPDFIEAKGYVHVGYSRRRLEREDMPSHGEVLRFSRLLGEKSGYRIRDSAEESKVVLLERG